MGRMEEAFCCEHLADLVTDLFVGDGDVLLPTDGVVRRDSMYPVLHSKLGNECWLREKAGWEGGPFVQIHGGWTAQFPDQGEHAGCYLTLHVSQTELPYNVLSVRIRRESPYDVNVHVSDSMWFFSMGDDADANITPRLRSVTQVLETLRWPGIARLIGSRPANEWEE